MIFSGSNPHSVHRGKLRHQSQENRNSIFSCSPFQHLNHLKWWGWRGGRYLAKGLFSESEGGIMESNPSESLVLVRICTLLCSILGWSLPNLINVVHGNLLTVCSMYGGHKFYYSYIFLVPDNLILISQYYWQLTLFSLGKRKKWTTFLWKYVHTYCLWQILF